MAEKKDLDFIYTTIDKIFRLSIGKTGDYSGAKYDGDFSMSLEEAQRAKHEFIADSLYIKKGSKVLDMACGWGPFSKYITQERGAASIGLTLSQGQAEACQKNGHNVLVKDCRYIKPEDFGMFDAITCIGGLEHFCSVEEWKEGKQEKIYSDFFQTLYNLLPSGGIFYMQTMTFSKNMIDYEDFDINAKKGSAPHVLALMVKEFPGSWLPYGPEMVIRNAEPHFKLISQTGEIVTQKNLAGKIYVADFFFTRCPSICPVMTSELTRVAKVFADNPDIKIISHTVDPEYDTVEVLRDYAAKYNADPDQWYFVTGEKKEIYDLARKGYFIAAKEGDTGPVDFIHSQRFILVDKEKRIRGYYDGTDKKDVDRLIAEIGVLLINKKKR